MSAKNTKTPAMILQEFSVQHKYAPPTYEIVSSKTGTHENRFDYIVSIAGIVAKGTGSSKQIGKHDAARNALLMLKEMNLCDIDESQIQEFKMSTQSQSSSVSPESPFKSSPNCIGPLKDLCFENKIPYPVFTLISDLGPPHSREFTYECSVASIKTEATGSTKKMAKQLAAKDMMERIKDVLPEIAEQYSKNEGLKAITAGTEIVERYNKIFGAAIPDKSVKIGDISHTLKNLMKAKGFSFFNFSEEFSTRTEDALKRILNKLELTYNFHIMQMEPFLVSLSLDTDTSFTTLGMSSDLESAKADALSSAFQIMETFMQL